MDNMTVISAEMFGKAVNENLTVEEAVNMLKENTQIRTLRDKIEKFSDGGDVKSILIEGLLQHNPDAKRDSVARKVRGWLSDAERNISKKDAIELCFILNLDFERADEFVALVSEERFHWRDSEELGYIYALNNNFTYLDAQKINEEIKEYVKNECSKEEIEENSFTPLIKSEILQIKSKEELYEYVKDASTRLGKYHNTAYALFMEFLELLQSPYDDDFMGRTEEMTTREIVKEYFNQEFIPRFKQGEKSEAGKRAMLSAMEKNVIASWPDEVMLSKIKNREVDVNRKTLMLAFLVTNGGDSLYGDDDPEEYYEMSKGDLFREMYQRINTMLADCGFSRLDPRVPFDWMILYCMCVEETYEIDDKMKSFLENLFV